MNSSFRRSLSSLACLMVLAEAGHGSTQAYWRFEESYSGAVPAGSTGGSVTNTILDSSGNGNHMQTWNTGTAPSYTTNVFPTPNPSNYLELSHAANNASLDFAGQPRDIYTSNKPLNTKPFNALTVEASFCLDSLNRWQVVVGKDGNPVGGQPPFTIKVRANNVLEVGLVDGSGTVRNVVSTQALTANTWYHVAVTASPSTMMLYLKPQSSSEYLFLGSTTISGAFFNSYTAFNQPWIVGRGMWNGANADWTDGKIDEVRISDTALLPSQFLGSTEMVDADVDGLPDDWEQTYGLSIDPTTGGIGDNGPNGDSDNDGLSNFEEWRKQSSPVAYTYQNIVVGEDISVENSLSSGAFGSSNSVTGGGSTFLFGDDNSATNQYAGFIAGSENKLWSPSAGPGDSNILLGSKNSINPDHATAGSNILGSILMGVENASSQTQSWVLGMGNVGQTNTVILGTYNAEVPDAALIVGNGIGSDERAGERSNGLVVLKNGTVQVPSGMLMLGYDTAVGVGQVQGLLAEGKYLQNTGSFTGALGIGVGSAMAENSTSIGAEALARRSSSTAVGYQARALEPSSTAIGYANQASGTSSTAMGYANSAGGANSTAIGYGVLSSGTSSTALGYRARALGVNSAAFGTWTSAQSFGEIAIGAYNKAGSGNASSWVATDMQLVVGNGASTQDYSNALEVQKNGRARLINRYWDASSPTAVPSNVTESSNGEALSVEGHAVINGNTTLKGNAVLEGKVILAQPQGDISMGAYQ